jgi:hypothetical protein
MRERERETEREDESGMGGKEDTMISFLLGERNMICGYEK